MESREYMELVNNQEYKTNKKPPLESLIMVDLKSIIE